MKLRITCLLHVALEMVLICCLCSRLFAKVSLSYGGGPRSAALDLLLYDSLCWECDLASGECAAKTKETRCFFAAGTAPLHAFRIGRTVSVRQSPGQTDSKSHFASVK